MMSPVFCLGAPIAGCTDFVMLLYYTQKDQDNNRGKDWSGLPQKTGGQLTDKEHVCAVCQVLPRFISTAPGSFFALVFRHP
jgi:hypothetical protein